MLLAAGASRRWGTGGPKPLAEFEGRPVLERIARTARRAGVAEVLVVLGDRAEAIRDAEVTGVDRWLVNPRWPLGQSTSVTAGLRGLASGQWALLWPVDVPFVTERTVRSLLEAGREGDLAVWWTPTYEGRGGHPILLAPEAVRGLLELPDDVPLRAAPVRRGTGEFRMPVQDPGVLDNTNYPDGFARAMRAFRLRGGDR